MGPMRAHRTIRVAWHADLGEVQRAAVQQVQAPHAGRAELTDQLQGIIGTMQASEALKLAGQFGTPSVGRLHLLDGRTLHFTEIRVPRDPDCPVCAHRAPQAR